MGGTCAPTIGRRLRLGSPEYWPQTLRSAVKLMLAAGHPMCIWWGEEGACLYNDAYRPSLGPERHPSSLGRSVREVWEEIWHITGPRLRKVTTTGIPSWHENQLAPITRNGRREDAYWTYSYSPIKDEGVPQRGRRGSRHSQRDDGGCSGFSKPGRPSGIGLPDCSNKRQPSWRCYVVQPI